MTTQKKRCLVGVGGQGTAAIAQVSAEAAVLQAGLEWKLCVPCGEPREQRHILLGAGLPVQHSAPWHWHDAGRERMWAVPLRFHQYWIEMGELVLN